MFCATCGAPAPAEARFCERCRQPMAAAMAVHQPPTVQPRQERTRIVAAVALVALAAGAVAWLFVAERGNSPEEIVAKLEQTWVQGIEHRDPALLREYFSDPERAERALDGLPAGYEVSVVSTEVVSATDRRIIARVVIRFPSSDPEAAPGEYETVESYSRYDLVDTDDGEEWRFVSAASE